jgi:hypothetical protein
MVDLRQALARMAEDGEEVTEQRRAAVRPGAVVGEGER